MTRFFWSKAAPGLYYLRATAGGSGPAIARVWRPDDKRGAVIYEGRLDYAGKSISLRERSQPQSFIPLFERNILISFPDAVFSRENF